MLELHDGLLCPLQRSRVVPWGKDTHIHTLGEMLKRNVPFRWPGPGLPGAVLFLAFDRWGFPSRGSVGQYPAAKIHRKTPQSSLWKQVDRVSIEGIVNWLPSQLSTEITSHRLGNRVVVKRAVFF